MEKKEFCGHQGDVVFISIDKIDVNFKAIKKTFIAKSEKSGHAHALCGNYDLYIDERIPDTFIIDVKDGGAILNHTHMSNLTDNYFNEIKDLPKADHGFTPFEPGIYKVGIQRRNNPFRKIWEKVID